MTLKTLREDRTAAVRCGKCRRSDPPQAENPAKQDSFLFHRKIYLHNLYAICGCLRRNTVGHKIRMLDPYELSPSEIPEANRIASSA